VSKIIRWEAPTDARRISRWQEYAAAARDLANSPGKWGVLFEGPHIPANSLSSAIKNGSAPFAPKGAFESVIRTGTELVNGRMEKVVRTYARYVGDTS